MKRVLALIIVCSIFLGLLPMKTYAATSPQDMVKKMGIGINIGNTLEAPTEGSWSKAAEEYYFDDFKQAGFNNVRIPIRWDLHTQTSSPYTIDSSFLDRVEKIVDWSLAHGFVTVINSHHDAWIMDDYNGKIARFEKIWEQVADRFKGKSENLIFEILNEPHGDITDSQINDMNKRILNIIRENNPTRNVIIGAGSWNSFNTLSQLDIPKDPYLIATYHYYEPYSFTHQWKGTWGTQSDKDSVVKVFDRVKSWSETNNIPVYLGEFGVMGYSDRTSAVKWFDFISDQAVAHGFSCSAWDNGVFGSVDNDMAFYHRDTRNFDQEILDAVIKSGTTYISPTPTPPQPTRPPVTPAAGEKVLDNFEGTLSWSAYSGSGSDASCKIADGKSGNGLEINYSGSTNGYWGVSNNKSENWETWLKLSFDLKSTNNNEVRVLISEKGTVSGEDGEHWVYTIKPETSWKNIVIPFSSFTKRLDYQPPAQDDNGTLDLYKVNALHFMYSNGNSGILSVDNVKVIGTSAAEPTDIPKNSPTNTPTATITPSPVLTKTPQPTGTKSLLIGAWVGTQPIDSELKKFQDLQQRKLDIVHSFINWSTDFDTIKPYADAAASNGSTLMITWEPWEYNTVDIKDGKADSYITKMANDIKSYGKEIWLRPLHEANGDWYPWALGYKSGLNTNDTYKAAFKHLVEVFRTQGVTNVKWIYNVNCSSVGKGTSYLGFYPGDEYVDYTSIDGYNWGTTQSWGSKWQSFNEVFSGAYNSIKSINKPIIIAEYASTEIGGDKAKWITETFDTVKSSYDKIFAMVWFGENKETDWRINSSPAALEAYKKAVAIESVKYIYGDVNGDNAVDSADYTYLRAYLLGKVKSLPAPDWQITADVKKDGIVDSADYTALRKFLLNIVPSLPI